MSQGEERCGILTPDILLLVIDRISRLCCTAWDRAPRIVLWFVGIILIILKAYDTRV